MIIQFLAKVFLELPILILTVWILTETKQWFFAAAFGATFVVTMAIMYLFPIICLRCEAKFEDLPQEKDVLRKQIEALCSRIGYRGDKIMLMEHRGGDLHSNAIITQSSIKLGDQLLKHHDGHDSEILGIVAHELGHWKKKHLLQGTITNMAYMLVFGLLMKPVIDNNQFLAAFNIYTESYFMTLVLFTLLYINSLDVVLRLFINAKSRENELEADQYAV